MLVYDIMMYITLFQALKIILKSISLSTSPRVVGKSFSLDFLLHCLTATFLTIQIFILLT